MPKKRSATGKSDSTVDGYILDSGTAETLWARGEIDLTDRQIAELSTQPTIALAPEQAPKFKPKNRKMPVEWLKPLEAVHWLSPYVGGDANAKLAIAERLKDGVIECAAVWLCESLDKGPLPTRRPTVASDPAIPGTAYQISPPTPRASEIRLGGAFYSFSDDWEGDLKRWNWRSGIFVTSNKRGAKVQVVKEIGVSQTTLAPARMVAFGVRFSREDVEKISKPASSSGASSSESPEAKPRKRGRTGPRPKKHLLSAILARLESEILSGEIRRFGNVAEVGVQSAIEREIENSFPPDERPSESTIRRKVVKLMAAWREISGAQ